MTWLQRIRVRCVGIAVLAVLSVVSTASAQRRVTLAYSATANDCPTDATFRRAVNTLLLRDAFDNVADRRMVVRIEQREESLYGSLAWARSDGSFASARELLVHRSTCRALASTLALQLAIAIDPAASEQLLAAALPDLSEPREPVVAAGSDLPSATQHEPAVEPGADSENASLSPTRTLLKPTDNPRWGATFRLELMGNLGTSPALVGAGAGALTLERDSFVLGLQGRVDAVGWRVVDRGSFEVRTVLVELSACAAIRWIRLCGLAGAGTVRSEGIDLVNSRSDTQPLVAVGAQVRVEIPLGAKWFLAPGAYVHVPLNRVSVTVGGQEVWRVPSVNASISLGIGMRIL